MSRLGAPIRTRPITSGVSPAAPPTAAARILFGSPELLAGWATGGVAGRKWAGGSAASCCKMSSKTGARTRKENMPTGADCRFGVGGLRACEGGDDGNRREVHEGAWVGEARRCSNKIRDSAFTGCRIQQGDGRVLHFDINCDLVYCGAIVTRLGDGRIAPSMQLHAVKRQDHLPRLCVSVLEWKRERSRLDGFHVLHELLAPVGVDPNRAPLWLYHLVDNASNPRPGRGNKCKQPIKPLENAVRDRDQHWRERHVHLCIHRWHRRVHVGVSCADANGQGRSPMSVQCFPDGRAPPTVMTLRRVHAYASHWGARRSKGGRQSCGSLSGHVPRLLEGCTATAPGERWRISYTPHRGLTITVFF
eukprot:scaffold249325_cov30-Tisochrysis_lutea.AAC.6